LKFTDRDPALPGSPRLLEKRKPARSGLRFPFGKSIADVSGFDFPVSFREACKASLQNSERVARSGQCREPDPVRET